MKYTAKKHLFFNHKHVFKGDVVELTDEQFKKYGGTDLEPSTGAKATAKPTPTKKGGKGKKVEESAHDKLVARATELKIEADVVENATDEELEALIAAEEAKE